MGVSPRYHLGLCILVHMLNIYYLIYETPYSENPLGCDVGPRLGDQ